MKRVEENGVKEESTNMNKTCRKREEREH